MKTSRKTNWRKMFESAQNYIKNIEAIASDREREINALNVNQCGLERERDIAREQCDVAKKLMHAYRQDCDKKDAALFVISRKHDEMTLHANNLEAELNVAREDGRGTAERLKAAQDNEKLQANQIRELRLQLNYYVELTRRICSLG